MIENSAKWEIQLNAEVLHGKYQKLLGDIYVFVSTNDALPFSGEPKYVDVAATVAHKCAMFNNIGTHCKRCRKQEYLPNL
jgi:hypothetical protein